MLHGIERECLRVDETGRLSQKRHPVEFGSALTNKWISTDFSEAQLELITPPEASEEKALKFLKNIHEFIAWHDEWLWPSSAPCILDGKIPLGYYGETREGIEKTLYREGLSERYGSKMQTMSGIHYNLSFEVWPVDRFHLIRNFLRFSWLNTYLFGASPCVHETYTKEVFPFATSIRMSELGYYSKVQKQLAISFNSLEDYEADLQKAITTPDVRFKGLRNENQLQIPAEHYSRIRPKINGEGQKYVEIRAVDIDPFSPEGVNITQLKFLRAFAQYCMSIKSAPLTYEEQQILFENQNLVALQGRRPGLKLANGNLMIEEGTKLLQAIEPFYGDISAEVEKLNNPAMTPSAIVARGVSEKGFVKFNMDLAREHRVARRKKPLDKFVEEADRSLAQLKYDEMFFEGWEDQEISTQALLRECWKQGVEVEVLNRAENFFRLSKDGKTADVKQATMTEKDSLITYHRMNDKIACKHLLKKAGILVPGKAGNKSVVKPADANYGLGVSVVEGDVTDAVALAKKYSSEVIVEEFVPGEEYRLLVINGEVVAVCHRIPANVVGDGKRTLKELIRLKNRTKPEYYHIREEGDESIPTGRIFLRKNSNVSTGGDSIDVTDDVHPYFREIAVQAANVVEATFCGVDLITKNISEKGPYAIIELNHNPALWIHRYPAEGVPRIVERDVLKALLGGV